MSEFQPRHTQNQKLGAHHFAYLRALAEGIDPLTCAKVYLDASDAQEARDAHKEVLDTARAIARRRPQTGGAWRLLGLMLKPKEEKKQPSLEDFRHERNLEDWDEQTVIDMYVEQYPEQGLQQNKPARRRRLFDRQMELIRTIESTASIAPSETDSVEGWFDPETSSRLAAAGLTTLGDLVRQVYQNPTWYARAPAIGPSKAKRIEAQAKRLLPKPAQISFHLPPSSDDRVIEEWLVSGVAQATAKNYRRESLRLQLWLLVERSGIRLADMQPDDCAAYKSFLTNIPPHWIAPSTARRVPYSPGWAPFREQLAEQSRAICISTLTSLYDWMTIKGYCSTNPWLDRENKAPRSQAARSLSRLPQNDLHSFIAAQPASIEQALVAVISRLQALPGITTKSLINAELANLKTEGAVAIFRATTGRELVLPDATVEALKTYLSMRGVHIDEGEHSQTPLLANPRFPNRPLTFRKLTELISKWELSAKTWRAP